MAGINVSVKVTGLPEIATHLRELAGGRLVGQVARTLYRVLKTEGVPESVKRAPILRGPLRESIRVEGPVLHGSKVVCRIAAGGPGIGYALRWHEQPFNLGPVSLANNAEGLIGDKYITRTADAFKAPWQTVLADDIGHLIQTGQATTT